MDGRFVAGLDGGGSKTALCCMDARGGVLLEGAFGPLNVHGTDPAAIARTLRDIVLALSSMDGGLPSCAGITVAAAGASNPVSGELIGAGLREAGYRGPFGQRGDHEAALRGAVGATGAVLIAGTGSICFGRNEAGETARSGGWGYLLDDEGGGYAIGRDILRAVLRAADGRAVETALTAAVYGRLRGARPEDLVRAAYAPSGKAAVAGLAPLLEPACLAGDAAAKRILRRAAGELALLCGAVIGRLRLDGALLALTGGVLLNNAALAKAVRLELKKKHPLLRVTAPLRDAAWGAADLARETWLPGESGAAMGLSP